jgi:hypothetical protein
VHDLFGEGNIVHAGHPAWVWRRNTVNTRSGEPRDVKLHRRTATIDSLGNVFIFIFIFIFNRYLSHNHKYIVIKTNDYWVLNGKKGCLCDFGLRLFFFFFFFFCCFVLFVFLFIKISFILSFAEYISFFTVIFSQSSHS